MHTLLRRIQIGIGAGTAIYAASAGCSTSVMRTGSDAEVDNDAHVTRDAADDATVVHDAGRDATLVVDAGPGLVPYPLDAWACAQDANGVFTCGVVGCYAGDPWTCPAADSDMPPFGVSFGCEARGPFAFNPDDPAAPAPGDCCYVWCSQAIEGRPLFVDASAIVAPVVVSSAWLIG